MELGNLVEWNPWWENKNLIEELKGVNRPSYTALLKSVGIKEITIITGVRRSGKSTLMYQMIENLLKQGIDPKQILFVNLEDRRLSQDTLDGIYEAYRENINSDKKAFIFLDEVHRKEGWESWIRRKYDLKTDAKFIISGSCSYLLKKEYSTLLTGRNITFEVFPLSFEEFMAFKGVPVNKSNLKKGIITEKTRLMAAKFIQEYLSIGGFPEIFFKTKNYKIRVLEQYFDDIVYKDIVDRYNLNAQKAKELALFFMTNFTRLTSLRTTRSMTKFSYDTIKDYISYFLEASLFFILDHFSYSIKEQKTLPSKIYCIDNGLRNAASFKFSQDYGKLAENMLLVELKRRGKDVYYWKNKGEIDFIIKNLDASLSALNITYTDDVDKRETDALIEFKKKFKRAKELILITKNIEKSENGIKFIPLWKWLLLT